MNDRQLEKKIQHDTAEMRRDLDTLMNKSSSKITQGFDKLKVDAKDSFVEAKDSFVEAAGTVKKEVGHGLSQYNAKAEEYANKVPGGWGEMVSKYPWVAITVGLGLGVLLGGLLKPSRQS